MKIVGIVCEYNPFHKGHEHQLSLLREKGAETVVCAMSGNYTQRGELAVADKYTRAEAALRCGADLVVELPFPYSSLSAEGFCRAGVHILSSLGCDTLSFGSESGDTQLLRRAAEIVNSEDFIEAYASAQKNTGSAKAYFDLLSERLEQDTALLSNDILGISYLSAILKEHAKMDVFPVKREGAAYHDIALGDVYPSATALRKAIKESENGFFSLSAKHVPTPSLETLRDAQIHKSAPVFKENIGSDIVSFFRLMSPQEIVSRTVHRSGGGTHVACDGCGIVERLCACARTADELEGMLADAYNSRYTDARINRVLLFSLIGVSDVFEKKLPEYATLLAASERGRKHLSEIRKGGRYPIVTKPADAPEGVLTDLIRFSDSLYASAMPGDGRLDRFMKMHPYMG